MNKPQLFRLRLVELFVTIIREAQASSDGGGEEAGREHGASSEVACSRKLLWVEAMEHWRNR